jgi:hypothetical protein
MMKEEWNALRCPNACDCDCLQTKEWPGEDNATAAAWEQQRCSTANISCHRMLDLSNDVEACEAHVLWKCKPNVDYTFSGQVLTGGLAKNFSINVPTMGSWTIPLGLHALDSQGAAVLNWTLVLSETGASVDSELLLKQLGGATWSFDHVQVQELAAEVFVFSGRSRAKSWPERGWLEASLFCDSFPPPSFRLIPIPWCLAFDQALVRNELPSALVCTWRAEAWS